MIWRWKLVPLVALVSSVMAWSTACCMGSTEEILDPDPKYMELVLEDPVTPAEAVGDAPPAAVEDSAPTLASMLGPDLIDELEMQAAVLATAHSAADFATAYRSLEEFTGKVAPPLQVVFERAEAGGGPGLPPDLFKDHPYYALGWGAEGMAVLVEMPYAPLRAQAAVTPELADDAFLDLLELMYADDATADSWSSLDQRNWDYGGCSPLGSGLHHRILRAADVALSHGDLFAPEIAAVRDEVIKDILVDDEYFPYCTDFEENPTPLPKLRAEVDSILADVRLSSEERAQLTARREQAFTVHRGKMDRE